MNHQRITKESPKFFWCITARKQQVKGMETGWKRDEKGMGKADLPVE